MPRTEADALIGALIGLARAMESGEASPVPESWRILRDGLAAASGADAPALRQALRQVQHEKLRLLPDCASCPHPCGRTDDYDMATLGDDGEEVRRIKLAILHRLQAMAQSGRGSPLLLCDGLNQIGWGYQAVPLEAFLQKLEASVSST